MVGKGCIKVYLARLIETPLHRLNQNSYNFSCETGSVEIGSPGSVHWLTCLDPEVAHVTAAHGLLARCGHMAST